VLKFLERSLHVSTTPDKNELIFEDELKTSNNIEKEELVKVIDTTQSNMEDDNSYPTSSANSFSKDTQQGVYTFHKLNSDDSFSEGIEEEYSNYDDEVTYVFNKEKLLSKITSMAKIKEENIESLHPIQFPSLSPFHDSSSIIAIDGMIEDVSENSTNEEYRVTITLSINYLPDLKLELITRETI